jgi:DNA-binding NarL/FixJ family response regulator
MDAHQDRASEQANKARRGKVSTMHVVLVPGDEIVAGQMLAAFEKAGRHRVTVCHDVSDLSQTATTPDVILIDVQQFAALRENEPMVYLRLSRRSRIIVILSSRELLDASHILAFADAWVFEDINLSRVSELIELGLEGHCILPKQFLSRMGVDEIRLSLLPRLTDVEFRCLQLLGQGLNNRTIAEKLNLSEAVIKSMVRSVLAKLHFRNRTEAGVFAARQQHALLPARQGESRPSMDEARSA